jgi:hypothetical protein
VRTRALITTLFARLFLSDLFMHGIGGAKYDHVTDTLVERFFGVKPPCYMTLTATLRLPIARQAVSADDARKVDRALRDLIYHPERSLAASSDRAEEQWVNQKRRWIEAPETHENAKQRCHAIRAANEALQAWVAPQREQLLKSRDEIGAKLRAESLLASREYAFCLHPAEPLRRLMTIDGE